MTLFTRSALATLVIAMLAGCSADEREWMAGDQEFSTGDQAITVQVAVAVSSAATSGLLPSPLLGPDRISVFVGDELVLDLELVNPGDHSLIVGQLPTGAAFSADATGGLVSWTPQLSDTGGHQFILYAVLTDNPEQIMGTAAIDVSVVPHFGLIEYGF
jgi:hypothetical protein